MRSNGVNENNKLAFASKLCDDVDDPLARERLTRAGHPEKEETMISTLTLTNQKETTLP